MQMHFSSRIRRNIIYIVLIFLPFLGVSKESKPWDSDFNLGKPIVKVKMFSRFAENPEFRRLDIYIETVYDVIQFIRDGEGFSAALEINLSISEKDGEMISRKIEHEKLEVGTYAETNSASSFLLHTFQEDIPPGEYEVSIVITDQESRRKSTSIQSVLIGQIEKSQFAFSDLMLAKTKEVDSQLNSPSSIIPSGRVQNSIEELYYYFDLYRLDPSKIVKFSYYLEDRDNNIVLEDSVSIVGGERISLYTIPISIKNMNFGKYKFVIDATCEGKNIRKETKLTINYKGLPSSIAEIDTAIDQLIYVTDNEEITRLKSLPSSHKQIEFINFWNSRFPVHNSNKNGKMLEYYSRVEYANQNFKNAWEGWKTDMGKIYIIFGPPSEVERHAFVEQGSPYEIWYYSNLNRSFVFQDEIGFGNYRLITPVW